MNRVAAAPNAGLQVVVLARWPAPGRCKSRLAAGIGRCRAAGVQARLTRHVTAVVRQAQLRLRTQADAPATELVLAVDGLGPRAARRWGGELGVDRVVPQGEGGLGCRLQRQLLRARREGARRVVLLGSDLPTVEPGDLTAAFRALEEASWVLGPAQDGGYWLIAARQPHPSPFVGSAERIAWGTETVLASTLRLADRYGISVPLLARRADLDRPADLEAWR
ncbi:MAG: TIGR04282 family arsenosugar biosynthesis glycosyltransferase [Cyanobium sp.]|nr:TIGR04282 family arsenosugar biosynthesis glycosyltransferase [Synechococcaceae cyanobacterium]